MLKSELELKLKKVEQEFEDFKNKVDKGLREQLDTCCDEAITPIEEFCDTLGIPFPTKTITITIPYGRVIGDIRDEDYDDMIFNIVNE